MDCEDDVFDMQPDEHDYWCEALSNTVSMPPSESELIAADANEGGPPVLLPLAPLGVAAESASAPSLAAPALSAMPDARPSDIEKTPEPARRRVPAKTTPVKVSPAPVTERSGPIQAPLVHGFIANVEEEPSWDPRTAEEKKADLVRCYNQVRLYYYNKYPRNSVPNATGKDADKRHRVRNYIQGEFTKLPWSDKQAWYKRTMKAAQLSPEDQAAFENWNKYDNGRTKQSRNGKKLWNVKKVMLCYHDDGWLLARPEWPLQATDVDAASCLVRKDPQFEKIYTFVDEHVAELVGTLSVVNWSFSLELCPKRFEEDCTLKVHAHVVMEFAKNQSAKLPTYRMGTLLPAHAMCSEGSKRGSNSPNPLHYYVQMPKQGMLLFKTNFAAFADFKVNPRWITGYLQSKKMTVAGASGEYVKCCHNLTSNLQNLKTLAVNQHAEITAAKKRIIHEALRGQLCAFRAVPEKDPFLAQFAVIKSRYKFLVACGPSGTGKTVWAKWLLGNPDVCLEVNCASCPEPDLRALTPKHRLILYDEASCEMVLKQKKLLQGPPDDVLLGCSTTNCHSYNVFVSGVGMVICSNTWFAELEGLDRQEDRDWLNHHVVWSLSPICWSPLVLYSSLEPFAL